MILSSITFHNRSIAKITVTKFRVVVEIKTNSFEEFKQTEPLEQYQILYTAQNLNVIHLRKTAIQTQQMCFVANAIIGFAPSAGNKDIEGIVAKSMI